MRTVIAASVVCLFIGGLASAAEVEAARRPISIPAQGLGPALQALARSRDLQVVYRSEVVQGLRTGGASGELTVGEALTQLLRGTGLTYRYLEDKAITIVPALPVSSGQSAPAAATGPAREAIPSLNLAAAALTPVEIQESGGAAGEPDPSRENQAEMGDMVIFGQRITTRNREDTVEPVLVYSSAYFERFEPLTLDDMLKRVPGVYFDRLFNLPANADGVAFAANTEGTLPRLRNLDVQFSQVLVNGRRIAGIDFGYGGDAFLAAIPAEAVKEIRVIRSPSAGIDSSGVGMTLDVILKDGSRYADSSWRAGGSYVDHELEGMGSVNVRGSTDRLTYSFNATLQNRTGTGLSVNHADQLTQSVSGTRTTRTVQVTDGRTNSLQRDANRSAVASVGFDVGNGGKLGIEARYFDTTRTAATDQVGARVQTRTVTVGADAPTVTVINTDLSADNDQERTTTNYGAALTYARNFGNLGWDVLYGYDRTDLESAHTIRKPEAATGGFFISDIADARGEGRRRQFDNHFSWNFAPRQELRFGADWQRSTDVNDSTSRANFSSDPADGYDVVYAVDRQTVRRTDAYAAYEWRMDNGLSLQAGVRHESADYDSDSPPVLGLDTTLTPLFQFDPDVLSSDRRTPFSASVSGFNPSAHLRWQLRDNHTLRFSVARTVRRPNLGELDPQVYIAGYSFAFAQSSVRVGSPALKNEQALGFDVGYDWRFTEGVIGLNFFTRDIERLIEEVRITPEELAALRPELAPEIARFTEFLIGQGLPEPLLSSFANSGKRAKVNGVELDLSFPLNFISDSAHLYMNATYSRQERADEPPRESSALNFSYDHQIAPAGLTYGMSVNWITRDTGHSETLSGLVSDRLRKLDPNVEVFLEKKFGQSLLARLTVENLTDANDLSTSASRSPTSSGATRRLTESDPRIMLTVRGRF